MGSLTQPQIKPRARLRDEHILVGSRKGATVAERPNGRRVAVQPNGRPAKAALVERVQSYLSLERC